jgi:hypothetical protein
VLFLYFPYFLHGANDGYLYILLMPRKAGLLKDIID